MNSGEDSQRSAVFEATFRNVEVDSSMWTYHLALMGEESDGLDESIPIDADHAAYSRSVDEPGWEVLEPRFMLTPRSKRTQVLWNLRGPLTAHWYGRAAPQ